MNIIAKFSMPVAGRLIGALSVPRPLVPLDRTGGPRIRCAELGSLPRFPSCSR